MATQLGLFSSAPTLNVLRDLKTAMAQAADATGISREELCDRYGVRMVKGTGPNLTLATLKEAETSADFCGKIQATTWVDKCPRVNSSGKKEENNRFTRRAAGRR